MELPQLVPLQMVSVPDPTGNFAVIKKQLDNLQPTSSTLVVLPECFACFGAKDKSQLDIAETFGEGPIQQELSAIAKEYSVWLVAGTIPIQAQENGKFYATSLVFNDQGQRVADYQKIHMFDVTVADKTGSYLESRYTSAGNKIVVIDSPFGRLGIAVCYDLRFPALFDAMGQIDVLALPAAFTQKTGEAHWHPLLQARSIEKQCYVVAANQGGTHLNGRSTFGHSCVYSPWGELLGEIAQGEGLFSVSQDLNYIREIRAKMPVAQHNKFRSKFVK